MIGFANLSCAILMSHIPRGSSLIETYTRLKSFLIYNPLLSFQNSSPAKRPVCEKFQICRVVL